MDENFQRELQAMSAIGSRRQRVRTVGFAIAFFVLFALFYGLRFAGLRVGLLYIVLLSVPIAMAVGLAVASSMTPGIIKQVSQEFDVPEDKLGQKEFLVD